ncbi:ammonium transporter [Psychrosphaera aquimarina]|uniref:Ammonium transporter n=1 Tax=Psychrosphaera aquimarina TaxID=2044854 RepID=A0ABU3QVL9_9GAMM|nr:ammonium transporter [Psychrosphaera aquimarina]MDU0111480.1 ammonium transporter [Psychrosphaera aquimarina]
MTIDTLWLMFGTILVLIMQAGFLCFESGLTRTKNSINVAMKNLADLVVTFMVWWAVGFGLSFGDSWSGTLGTNYFFVTIDENSPELGSFFLFQAMFCATAITIVSGAIAERTRFSAYIFIAVIVAALIYPIFTHLTWGGALGGEQGYLGRIGFVDFAGSTVVHSLGGWASLAAILIIGPRTGVFEKGRQHISASNLTLATLAIILFIIGWIGFNAGSTLEFNNLVPTIIVNTIMAAMAGGISSYLLSIFAKNQYVQTSVAPLNGIIAGLVSITAGCHAVGQPAAIVIGAVGGVIVYYGSALLARYKIDDAIDAIPAHLFAGIWGTLAVAIFADLSLLGTGLSRWEQLQAQLIGIIACAVWTFTLTWCLLKTARYFFRLRVTPEQEEIGLNVSEHGARTDLIDFLLTVNDANVDKDLSKRLPVEPFTEVGQIAQKYNQLMERAEDAVQKTKTIIKDVQAGILTLDKDANVINANPAAKAIFGITDNHHFPLPLNQLIHRQKALALPQLVNITHLPWVAIFDTIETVSVEGELTTSKEPIFLNMTASESSHNQGETICFVHDITLQKIAENDLFQEKEKAKKTLDSIGDGVISTSPNGNVQYINRTAAKLTGWLDKDALGKPLHRVFCAVDKITDHPNDQLIKLINQDKKTIITQKSQLLFSRSDDVYAIRYTASPIFDKDNKLSGIVIVFQDITQSQQIQSKLNHQATHDPLTDLFNRREFDIRLQQIVNDVQTHSNIEHSLIFIDLDEFKFVNDICGHAAGDTLLKDVSNIMKETIRHQDTLARLGGDEFAIILHDCPIDRSLLIAEKIREKIAEYKYIQDKKEFRVTTSVGVVEINEQTTNVQDVLIQADSACYTSKKRGKNQVSVFKKTDAEIEQISGDAHWAGRLQGAITQENGFELFFQLITPSTAPIAGQKPPLHFEILIRMKEDDGLIIPPNAFLPAAERYGLIHKIDAWVICHTFAWLNKQRKILADHQVKCAINLSGKSIDKTEIIEEIEIYQKEFNINPADICFEITETAAIGSISKASAFIERLRAEGFKFALDDFGAGLSSFNYLKNLPVNYLKIDGSFIRSVDKDPLDQAMVKSMADIGKTLGIQTVAEFVGSKAIADYLIDIGVDYLQGFHFHKPEPLNNLTDLIRHDRLRK